MKVHCVCFSRIITYFEDISEKLAREQDLSDPLIVETESLTFRGQTVSCSDVYIKHLLVYTLWSIVYILALQCSLMQEL